MGWIEGEISRRSEVEESIRYHERYLRFGKCERFLSGSRQVLPGLYGQLDRIGKLERYILVGKG
jgi:hypothetical protein